MKHPAKYPDAVLEVFQATIDKYWEQIPQSPIPGLAADGNPFPPRIKLYDPFAGTGRIAKLASPNIWVYGVEIEPEWAILTSAIEQGDALFPRFGPDTFDVVATSPCYGNRMADHHNAKDGSARYSYKHVLGRDLHPNNAGSLQWGQEYRDFHRRAWTATLNVLKPGGFFLLNIKDHKRYNKVQYVSVWHQLTIESLGCHHVDTIIVPTKGNRHGANAAQIIDYEYVIILQKDPF